MRLWKAGLYTTIWQLGEGYPLSWCLSNREDQILLIYYFEYLKKTGTISPKWFVSDDFDRFYNAGYQHSIDIHKKTIFWHVDCALRGALKSVTKAEVSNLPHSPHTS